jgi:hypothetical protein
MTKNSPAGSAGAIRNPFLNRRALELAPSADHLTIVNVSLLGGDTRPAALRAVISSM